MPTKVERSRWKNAGDPPENSIDLNLSTMAQSTSDSSDINWFKLSFNKVHCIKEIIWISTEPYWIKWTCTTQDCSTCHSYKLDDCSNFLGHEISAEVSTAGTPSDGVIGILNCRYGDTILIQHKMKNQALYVKEFVVLKEGESIYI